MIRLILEKEIKHIFASPKFFTLYLTASILILMSVFVGVKEFDHAESQYRVVQQIAQQQMQEAQGYGSVTELIHRKPQPLQALISGVHFDLGRKSAVNDFQGIQLEQSPYSDEPIFAVFRIMDLSYIVVSILTLFAFLFTYDAVNGEREQGTLAGILASGMSRTTFMLGKGVGIWLGFLLPLTLPFMAGLLLTQVMGMSLTSDEWLRLTFFFILTFLLLTGFIWLGIWVSTQFRYASHSFVALLMIWISVVLILPRLGVSVAGFLHPVASEAENQSKVSLFEQQKWDEHSQWLREQWESRNKTLEGLSESEQEQERKQQQPLWQKEDADQRTKIKTKVQQYRESILHEHTLQQQAQARLAYRLAGISPTAAFQFATMALAETDLGLKHRYLQQLTDHRALLTNYLTDKRKESGQPAGMEINISSEGGVQIKQNRRVGELDLSEKPEFQHPNQPMDVVLADIGWSFLLLGGLIFAGIGLSLIGIRSYSL